MTPDLERLCSAERSMSSSAGTPYGQYVGFEAEDLHAVLALIRAVLRGDPIEPGV